MRPRLSSGILFARLLAAALAGSPGPAAAFSTVLGGSGAPGADGAPGEPGADGGPGEDAFAEDVTAEVIATGGAGGPGGKGGAGLAPDGQGAPGGDGGPGGFASALVRVGVASGPAQATATARGGAGGDGGAGGAHASSGGTAAKGRFGDGGDAVAGAEASTGSADAVSVRASAFGGTSLYYYSDPGGAGGDATLAAVRGSSAGGAVRVVGEAVGGDGGLYASGSRGGDASAIDSADAVTSGPVDLTQSARGGSAQRGGSALSRLERAFASSDVRALVTASGGRSSGAGIGGGRADAHAILGNSAGPLTLTVSAYGGGGELGTSSGGDARASAVGTTSGDGRALRIGPRAYTSGDTAVGGSATQSAFGGAAPGRGGSASSRSEGRALGNSSVSVTDIARGGNGGSSDGRAVPGGAGGSADSYAFGSNAGASPVAVDASVFGGSGGSGSVGGLGGEARARARGESSGGGDVRVIATQESGGSWGGGPVPDSIMVDAVSGATTGKLTLEQYARARYGSGGHASSELTTVADGALAVVSEAEGRSAHAAASAETRAQKNVDVTVRSKAMGAGGVATLGPVAGVSAGGDVRVSASAEGGRGASDGNGDAPATVVLDAVSASTSGAIDLSQIVRAGGGALRADGSGGRGGDAVSLVSQEAAARSEVLVVEARAGAGAAGAQGATSGAGGDADARGDLVNRAGPVQARVFAFGGSGASSAGALYGSNASGVSGARGAAVAFTRAETERAGDGVRIGDAYVDWDRAGARGGSGGSVGVYTVGPRIGGAGGSAHSRSEGIARGDAPVTVYDGALGGAGGRVDSSAAPGTGGDGGFASSSALGQNGGDDPVHVQATASGGDARNGSSGSGAPGSADADARGLSTGGAQVHVSARARGGSGGVGKGASVSLVDAVSGGTAGRLVAEQTAEGGVGGWSAGGGGDAESSLEIENELGGELWARSVATAGSGDGSGDGGDAQASGVAHDFHGKSVELEVEAVAGSGGYARGPADAGDAGRASLGRVFADSLAGGIVRVRGVVRAGGAGASYGGSAPGRDASLEDAVDGSTSGALALEQHVYGGSASSGLAGSRGGAATSRLRKAASSSSLFVAIEATAGSGSAGGAAVAATVATNDAGSAVAIATARGGDGRAERGGVAQAEAEARTLGDAHPVTAGTPVSYDGYSATGAFGGGAGGNAVSRSLGHALGDSLVEIWDYAQGGANAVSGPSPRAGSASSRAEGRNQGASPVRVNAMAVGGDGAGGYGLPTGAGGEASASAHGESSGGGDVTVTVTQVGGDGAESFDGAESELVDAATGATAGKLALRQRAVGGAGGTGRKGAPGRSSFAPRNEGEGALDAVSEAEGGAGGGALAQGESGEGGDATASIVASDDAGVATSVLAIARGGAGGGGPHYAQGAGGDGGIPSLGQVYASSSAGAPVDVAAELQGGAGGLGGGGGAASGGDGRSVDMRNAVDGSTSGALALRQLAVGGAAGGIHGLGAVGAAGRASSVLERRDSVASLVHDSSATGGAGGNREALSGRAGDGAAGEATAVAENRTGSVSVLARAVGGAGGSGSVPWRYGSPPQGQVAGGDGGDARVTARGVSHADGQPVRIGHAPDEWPEWEPGSWWFAAPDFGAYGGQAGSGAYASSGSGGDATSDSFGLALGHSDVEVWDVAQGGAPPHRGSTDLPGGGDASSRAVAKSAGGGAASANAFAQGGASVFFVAGRGGDARAHAEAKGGVANARAQAAGGTSSFAGPEAGVAEATARARGWSGAAESVASNGVLFDSASGSTSARATAIAPVAGRASSRAVVANGEIPATAPEPGYDATTLVTLRPDEPSVLARLAGAPGVAAGLDRGERVTFAGLASVAVDPLSGAGVLTYVSETELWFPAPVAGGCRSPLCLFVPDLRSQDAPLEPGPIDDDDDICIPGWPGCPPLPPRRTTSTLAIGLLGAESIDFGFDALRFSLAVEGETVLDEIFHDRDAAVAFFEDRLLDLGSPEFAPYGYDLDVSLRFEITTSCPDSGFRADMLVALIAPEPSPASLLAAALVGLALLRRRHA